METLSKLLDTLAQNIPNHTLKKEAISKSTIGWQIDHTLKVFNTVALAIQQSQPSNYKSNINLKRLMLFTLGYIPRGKAQAPKKVLPPQNITKQSLVTQIEEAQKNLNTFKTLPDKSWFSHHVFGILTKKQTRRFLEVHTKHHIKIIEDILK